MTRSCGDGVKDTNGRGNNGHVDCPANSAIVGQLVGMEDTGKILATFQLCDTEQVKEARVEIARKKKGKNY